MFAVEGVEGYSHGSRDILAYTTSSQDECIIGSAEEPVVLTTVEFSTVEETFDLTGDGRVDTDDVDVVIGAIWQGGTSSGGKGDFDKDDEVTVNDLNIMIGQAFSGVLPKQASQADDVAQDASATAAVGRLTPPTPPLEAAQEDTVNVFIRDFEIELGKTKDVQVWMNCASMWAFQVDLQLPEGVTIEHAALYDWSQNLSELYRLETRRLDNGNYRLLVYCIDKRGTIGGTKMRVIDLTLKAAAEAPGNSQAKAIFSNFKYSVYSHYLSTGLCKPECNVWVHSVFVKTITLDPSSAELGQGESVQITATVLPEDAKKKTLIWYSSDDAVATVSADGLVTATPGVWPMGGNTQTATIYAVASDYGHVKSSCAVTVHRLPVLRAPALYVSMADAGRVIELPFTVLMKQDGNLASVQLNVKLPQGLRPCADEDGCYGAAGADIPCDRFGAPVVAYSDNCDNPALWPNYTVLGMNPNKVGITANPCQFYTMYVTVDPENYRPGQEPMSAWLKYSDADDVSYKSANTYVTYVYFDKELRGDVNADGVVDVDDANAILNIIIRKKTASSYAGKADANGDGLVDVDDLNIVINTILRRPISV
ncbi:MAG: Ig-like domain-containing protein [Muribaculaceae bacterium]|nr:Ig-like domain-containing protein [Muribaculaceae bacterium]